VIIQFEDDEDADFQDMRFIVNFMYNVKELSMRHPERLDFTEYGDFESVCDHTMVGLVQRKKGDSFGPQNNSCFYGV
jgi:hypothetical protein